MQLNKSSASGAEQFNKTKRLNDIKSQKNLISQNYIQENTEQNNDGHNEEGRRQTEMENMEMRQTYGRPKMLKKSKLPWHAKVRPVIKQNRQDSLKFMIQNNEYKQAQGYLPPIPIEEKQKKQNFSPYNMIAKFDKDRNEFNNILERDKSDLLQEEKKSYKAILGSKYRPEEFVNLEIIKSTHRTGIIKKVIHLPSFKLYAAKEESINNRQTLNTLKQWLLFWQTKANQQDDSPFIKILNVDWNNPKGFVTITTEHMVEGSLENLLESVGTLPENAIQQICYPILKSLTKFYNLLQGGYGGLSPSQILFGPYLQIKLGLGLGCRGSSVNSTIYNIRPIAPKLNIFSGDQQNLWAKSNIKNNEIERSYDVLKFGLIILRASAGNFQMFSQSTSLFESLKQLMTEQGQKIVQKQDLCCVIHSQKQILDLQLHQKHDRQQGDDQIPFQFITFLKQRYSSTFIHFLCMCLQLSNKKRSSIQDLINYSFVKTKPNHSLVKVTLEDLHKITKPVIDLEGSKYHKKLDLIIKAVQSNIRQGKFELLPDFTSITKAKIVELAEDLEIPEQMLENKINEWKRYNTQY